MSRTYSEMKDSGFGDIGTIPRSWKLVRVKHRYDVYCGATPSENAENWDGDIAWIGPADMEDFGKIRDGKRYITKVGYESCATCLLPEGSVVLSTRAPIGKIQITDTQLCTNQGCKSLVKKFPENSTSFLAYFLFSIKERLQKAGTGTTFKELSTSALKNMPLPLPPLPEQTAIAAYLDDKCAVIDEIITEAKATIEEYKAWKASVIFEAVTKGLDPNAEMKDSGIEWIGKMPKHWRAVSLKRLSQIQTGNTPSKQGGDVFYSNLDGVPWIKADNLGTNSSIEETAEYLTDQGVGAARINPENAVYVCCIGTIGKVGYSTKKCACNQQINAVVFNSLMWWKFGYYSILSQEDQHWFYANGNVLKILNSENQKNIKITLPPMQEQKSIACFLDEKCAAIDAIIAEKEALIADMEAYKKSLIFECVTGKRRVS